MSDLFFLFCYIFEDFVFPSDSPVISMLFVLFLGFSGSSDGENRLSERELGR